MVSSDEAGARAGGGKKVSERGATQRPFATLTTIARRPQGAIEQTMAQPREDLAFCGIDGVAPAAILSRFGWIVPEHQLRSGIVAERHHRLRQWPYESASSVRRWAREDRASLRCLADTVVSRSGVPTRLAIKAGELADALKGSNVANLACQGWFTRLRNAFGSHVLRALAALPPETPVWFYTLMSADWRMPITQVQGFSMGDLWEPLRVRLYDFGLREQTGWVIASLHGEHMLGDMVHLHVHAVVVGEKAEAFEHLRGLRKFKAGDGEPVRDPIKRYEPANLPRQVGYLFQPRWTFKTDDDERSLSFGERGSRRRAPELNEALYLLWRARQRLTDVTWMHGIRLSAGFLVPN